MLTLKNSLINDGLLGFLQHNPSFSSYLADCAEDIEEITTLIEPVLQASQRCKSRDFFLQAVSLGSRGFLATNISKQKQRGIQATDIASSWAVGRGATCAINMQVKSISRCHAVITHHPNVGFLLMDLGSKNGTWINGSKVIPHTRYPLSDGDRLQFGTLEVELFISHRQGEGSDAAVDCMATTPG